MKTWAHIFGNMTVLTAFFRRPSTLFWLKDWKEIDVGFICLSKTFIPTADRLLPRGVDPVAIERGTGDGWLWGGDVEIGVKQHRHQASWLTQTRDTHTLWIEIRKGRSVQCFNWQLGAVAKSIFVLEHTLLRDACEAGGLPSPITRPGSHHCILCLGSESGSSELGSDLHKWLHCPGWGLGPGWIITGWECGDGGHCEKCDDCDDTNTDHSHGTVISWRVLAVSGHIPQSTLKSEQLFQHLKKHNIPWFKFCTDSIFSSVTLVVYLRYGRDTDMMMMRVACHGVRAVPAVPRPGTESINYAETLVARRHKAQGRWWSPNITILVLLECQTSASLATTMLIDWTEAGWTFLHVMKTFTCSGYAAWLIFAEWL